MNKKFNFHNSYEDREVKRKKATDTAESVTKAILHPKANDQITKYEYLYLFPELDEEDIAVAENRFYLTFLGVNEFNDEVNWVIAGDKKYIERYARNYLDYELHPEYLYKTDEFEGSIEPLMKAEDNETESDVIKNIVARVSDRIDGYDIESWISKMEELRAEGIIDDFYPTEVDEEDEDDDWDDSDDYNEVDSSFVSFYKSFAPNTSGHDIEKAIKTIVYNNRIDMDAYSIELELEYEDGKIEEIDIEDYNSNKAEDTKKKVITLGREIKPRKKKNMQYDDLWDTNGRYSKSLDEFCAENNLTWRARQRGVSGVFITGEMDAALQKEVREVLGYPLDSVINEWAHASAIKRTVDDSKAEDTEKKKNPNMKPN